MKVAFLTRDYPPSAGGISTHSSSLAKELQKAGVEVDVFVGRTDPKTLLLPLNTNLGEYDLVHAQSAPYGALVRRTPLVVTVHSPVPSEFLGYGLVLRLESMPAVPLEVISLTKARVVLSVSDATRDDVADLYRLPRRKVVVIGNGVDQKYFAENESRRNAKRIIIVSRLEPRKNVREAISAICTLPTSSYEAQIVGTGSQLPLLSTIAAARNANVKFLSNVSGTDLPSLYASAGIFLTTSLSEGFGLSLLEAMASGCAVLASDISTHRSLVSQGVNGMLYSSPQELRRMLGELLSSPELQDKLGKKARETASHHTWEAVCQKTLAAYQKAL